MHRVRLVLDEVFRADNFCGMIPFTKTSALASRGLTERCDYLLWYAKDTRALRYRQVFVEKVSGSEGASQYDWVVKASGERRRIQEDEPVAPSDALFHIGDASAMFTTPHLALPIDFQGKQVRPPSNRQWQTTQDGMQRLAQCERLLLVGNSMRYVRTLKDFPVNPLNALWTDTGVSGFGDPKVFVVQTNTKVIERCLLMTTDPGDLVLDPTCGSGTTAYTAELWGRRWITIDTSRVALAIARQRILTARFPHYALRPVSAEDMTRNPEGPWLSDAVGKMLGRCTFQCQTVPHITLKSIARNAALDPIFAKHEPILERQLEGLNAALKRVATSERQMLAYKLVAKRKAEGKKSVTEADVRRWELPTTEWMPWQVPFDSDPDWPKGLQSALLEYRKAWRAKMDDVNECIAKDAEMEELVDKPEIIRNVVRVSGPFTVEGVRPEELSLGDKGLFDPTPNELEEGVAFRSRDNLAAYLTQMVHHLRRDGLTFVGNKRKHFARVEPLFEHETASLIHAEGAWIDGDDSGNRVAIGFGPQYGPVTAEQVEDLIRSCKRYDELVVAGFSFDAEATAAIQLAQHPKLRVHQAYVRPDINPGMAGLLKDIPNSELFTVFGQPEVVVKRAKDGEWTVTLKGVDIYDPIANAVRSTGAEKVAAWFLDSDYDGRCFCVTQAFFPNQNAWEKIGKALGSAADAEAFQTFKGTESLPFLVGKHERIAVKVIDPRGNEVMAIRRLEA